jgi:hypothetical protein
MKEQLRTAVAGIDPLALLDEIRSMQHHLAGLAAGTTPHVVPQRDIDLDRFMKSLATAWHSGEVRPTHSTEPPARRDWRTRQDPFEAAWPQVVAWLEAEPDRTAKEMLEQLQTEHPGTYSDGQVRTLQRRVQEWRRACARRLVFGVDDLAGASSTAIAAHA